MKIHLSVFSLLAILVSLSGSFESRLKAQQDSPSSAAEKKDLPEVPVENSLAGSEKEMKKYREVIRHAKARIEMVPIPGGKFMMGSPESEEGRAEDEGPQHEVEIDPFWMSSCEVTWDAYEVFMLSKDKLLCCRLTQISPHEEYETLSLIVIHWMSL